MNNNILFFDGTCNLCNSSIQWILARDKKNIFSFASLQSSLGAKTIHDFMLENVDSIVYKRKGKVHIKSTAVLYIVKDLGSLYTLLFCFIVFPKFIRDSVYNFIAKHRYKWFGVSNNCWVMQPKWKEKFLD